MVKLYETQEKIEQKILDNLYLPEHDRIYLSGEPGVGKTYIASKLIVDVHRKEPNSLILVVTPHQVVEKFASVIHEFSSNIRIQVLTGTKDEIENKFDEIDVVIVADKDLSKVFKKYIDDLKNLSLLVYDEVHTAKGVKLKILEQFCKENNGEKHLYMTGTIFDTGVKKLIQLIDITHAKFVDRALDISYSRRRISTLTNEYSDNIYGFMNAIWQYISLSISLEDTKKDNNSDINQSIAPIKYIETNIEQKYFSDLISSQLKSLQIDLVKRNEMISDYLDNPEKELFINTKSAKRASRLRNDEISFIGLSLKDSSIKETAKYKRLKNIAKNNKGKTILVYARDKDLITTLSKALNEDNITASNVNTKLDNAETANSLKELLKVNNVVIVDYQKIATGIDVEADILVWYQLSNKIAEMIQAQKRIYRLSSKNSTIVHYLAYADSYQETIVNQVSNSAKFNAATYGTNLTDALAKITGLILPEI